MKKIMLLVGLLTCLVSCDSKKEQKRIFMESNGRMNHLLIVMEDDLWKGSSGEKLKEVIKTPVLGMPQEEFQFDVSQVADVSFGKMFKASKSVLKVRLDSIDNFEERDNVYAKPQKIITISGRTEASLVEMLELYKHKIISSFKDFDIQNVQANHLDKSYNKEAFKTLKKLGIQMSIPTFFKLVDDTGDFLWLRQHLSGGIAKGDGTSNILVYSLPMPASKDNLVKTITNMRDLIGKKYIPGRKPNMHMITEALTTPRVFQTKLAGKNAYFTFGKWEVLNDFMAGPFLNMIVEDEVNNRWVVLEAFVYAPSVDKRDYMFETEAILKSIKFN